MQRLLAFVLGLGVASAPQLVVCQFVCVASTAHNVATEAHQGHSGHHSPTPVSAETLEVSHHACDHADQVPAETGPSPHLRSAPLAILTTGAVMWASLEVDQVSAAAFEQRPPGPTSLTTPLRV